MSRYAAQNLFGVQGLNIAWYGVIVGIGMLCGITLAAKRARRAGLHGDLLYDFFLIAIPASVLCARLYYVAFQWPYYRNHLGEVFAIWHGGIAVYGGVIGGILVAILFCRRKKLPFLQLADLCIPGLLLGQSIGRWGNFVNQEAFGRLVTEPSLQVFPYAVYIDRLEEWHQATFFYESLWNLVLLCILLILCSRIHMQGLALPIYFIGYGLGRFWIEGLREDSLYLLPGLRISQLVSLCLIVLGGCVLIAIVRKQSKERSCYDQAEAGTMDRSKR